MDMIGSFGDYGVLLNETISFLSSNWVIVLFSLPLIILSGTFAWHFLVVATTRDKEAPFVPTMIPHLGHAVQFGQDAEAFLRICAQQHGSTFALLLAGNRTVMVV